MSNIKFVGVEGRRRLRVRYLDEEKFALKVQKKAIERGRWIFEVTHGGGVANAYKYPAETECALAVSDPTGLTVCWVDRASAKNITRRAIAENCIIGSGDLWDGRIKKAERRQDAIDLLKALHADCWSALEQLANCAEPT